MLVCDVMTKDVATVSPSATVKEIAELLLRRHISAAPVVEADGKLIGIVSEGDLVRRAEIDTESHRSWWLALFTSTGDKQATYIKEHGRTAEQIMTRTLVTTTAEATLGEVASLLEEHRVKRLPVVENGKVVGIISRANILQGLAAAPQQATGDHREDREIREAVMRAFIHDAGVAGELINVVVRDGVVQLWGTAQNDTAERAAIVAAESVAGVRKVESRIGRIPAWAYGY